MSISKELLSKVLDKKITSITVNGVNVFYENKASKEINNTGGINIHELAHKCKEWVKNINNPNGDGKFNLQSGVSLRSCDCHIFINNTFCQIFEAKTETEAIFKASQWMLDNQKSN